VAFGVAIGNLPGAGGRTVRRRPLFVAANSDMWWANDAGSRYGMVSTNIRRWLPAERAGGKAINLKTHQARTNRRNNRRNNEEESDVNRARANAWRMALAAWRHGGAAK